MSVLRYYGLYNLCIRVRGTPLYCNILVYPFVFSVVLWYSHRGTLISAVYPACMITVHGLILGASHPNPKWVGGIYRCSRKLAVLSYLVCSGRPGLKSEPGRSDLRSGWSGKTTHALYVC